tara:strand:- start:4175 stop:4492 length:318 start_codon:yes stop_codon:yes gene_type:complete
MNYLVLALTLVIVFLMWFSYRLLRNLYSLSEGIHDVAIEVGGFTTHLESIYDMEMFYGDETLDSLLRHSRELKENLSDFTTKNAAELEDREGIDEEEETNSEETE